MNTQMTTPVSPDMAHWIGRTTSVTATLNPAPLMEFNALAMNGQLPAADTEADASLPPLAHWLYFHPYAIPQDALGVDGLPTRSPLYPDLAFPHRVWAGSEIEFFHPLRLGSSVQKRSTITSAQHKSGQRANLALVQVTHELVDEQGVALVERQQMIFLERKLQATSAKKPEAETGRTDQTMDRVFDANTVRLFRYSALTCNPHRIHYDRDYAVQQEGYAGLVVAGPLIARLLSDLLMAHLPVRELKTFSCRAIAPLFDGPIHLRAHDSADGKKSAELWAQDGDGRVGMSATATWD